MSGQQVLIIGGGPAGVSAALELARAGREVTLCEQGPRLGGAIHRQPDDVTRSARLPRSHKRRWQALSDELAASKVNVLCRHMFAGIDATGAVLIEDRAQGRLVTQRPAALILAMGAIERVAPVPGWQLPGVVTAGGLQLMMKSTGRAPDGDVLIAGSGPLLLALAAQMAALGKAPAAVLERSPRLVSPRVIAGLLKAPAYLWEGAGYLLTLAKSGALPQRGAFVAAIAPKDGRLLVTLRDRSGRDRQVLFDRVALHDGLLPNSNGTTNSPHGPFIVRAGDCREVLGGTAALADGQLAARTVLAHLGQAAPRSISPTAIVARERQAQAALNTLFDYSGCDPALLPDETIICRCEGRTLGQLRALLSTGDPVSAREVKLNGRIGMGACQGRFCAEWVASFMASQRSDRSAPQVSEIVGSRWPVKPVPISAFITPPPSSPSE